MSELAFLLDLLLNHDELPKDVRIAIKDRIVWVEQNSKAIPLQTLSRSKPIASHLDSEQGSQTPETVAHTQAAQQALASRQQAIAFATSGSPEKGRTSPRKF